MPALERLPANTIRNLAKLEPGKYGDGGGLWLLRRPDGGGQWSFRYTVHGRQGEMGLGSVNDLTLADARVEARKWRAVAKSGVNPKKERDRLNAEAAKERPTFEMVFNEAFEARKADLKGDGAAGRWDSPIRVHILPKLGRVPVDEIDQNDIRNTLTPIWNEKPDAAKKALNRVAIVIRHAAAMGLNVDIQATEKAKALLGAQKRKSKNVPSLPWLEVPGFYQSLSLDTAAERALRLLILTAVRSVEVRFARFDEIAGNTWTIPAERMKSGKEHRVPLSTEALNVIEACKPFQVDGFLFPGVRKGVISDMTMNALMRRREMTERPHGFRSSFRTWCAEATDTPREVAEACLAHTSAGKVEAAYRRTDFLERRAVLMERWAQHMRTDLANPNIIKLESR